MTLASRNGWTATSYSAFRFVFGCYLAIHFAHLVPWGWEVFSDEGMLGEASTSPLYLLFPNILFVWDAPAFVTALLLLGTLLSVAFAIGFRDRIAAVFLWYLWACLFSRNPLISNPGLPFVGWLLLAHVFVPPVSFRIWDIGRQNRSREDWRMPDSIYTAGWIVMAVGYTYSGVTKLVSPSWLDGTALLHVLSNPLARPTLLRETLLALPDSVIQLATWGALGLEVGFAPLVLFRRLRRWMWLALVGMHLGLMTLIDFADLSAGMIMMHLFTFDPAWIRRGARIQVGGN